MEKFREQLLSRREQMRKKREMETKAKSESTPNKSREVNSAPQPLMQQKFSTPLKLPTTAKVC
jgi:hypothetical protein